MHTLTKGLLSSCLLCASLAPSPDAGAVGQAESMTSTHTTSVRTDSADGAAVLAWIARNSPEFPPRFESDTLEVARTIPITLGAGQRRPGDGPPIPLPATGTPGDVFNFSHERNGGFESWSYKWTSGAQGRGGWVLIAYQFKYFQENPR